jgi:uncharacterized hydrophobic protein (TIGR00271 family)
MLHVRVICPPDLTERALAAIGEEPGVTGVSVARGAGIEPVGDLIECDVARGAGTPLVERLRAVGVARHGSISVGELITVVGLPARTAFDEVSVEEDDAVVWEQITARVREDAELSVTFLVLMAIAGLLGGIAVLQNSLLLVVGAMIVAPDFGPVAGLAAGLVTRRREQALGAARAVLIGYPVVMAAAFVETLAIRLFGRTPQPYELGIRPVADLISNPRLSSFAIAVAAGFAGVISLGTERQGVVVGVVVSITTIPAASNVGVAVAHGRWEEAAGAALQLLINLVGLTVASVVGLRLARRLARRRSGTLRRTHHLP